MGGVSLRLCLVSIGTTRDLTSRTFRSTHRSDRWAIPLSGISRSDRLFFADGRSAARGTRGHRRPRSFSAAARALFTVQSNVSSHIARLEKELGVTLVDRAHGGLTDDGIRVVERARRVLRELDDIAADMAQLDGDVAGDVRLGMLGTTARWLMPRLLAETATSTPTSTPSSPRAAPQC